MNKKITLTILTIALFAFIGSRLLAPKTETVSKPEVIKTVEKVEEVKVFGSAGEMSWDEYQDYLSMLTYEGMATHKEIKKRPDGVGVIRGKQLNLAEYKARRNYLMNKAEKAERKLQ